MNPNTKAVISAARITRMIMRNYREETGEVDQKKKKKVLRG